MMEKIEATKSNGHDIHPNGILLMTLVQNRLPRIFGIAPLDGKKEKNQFGRVSCCSTGVKWNNHVVPQQQKSTI